MAKNKLALLFSKLTGIVLRLLVPLIFIGLILYYFQKEADKNRQKNISKQQHQQVASTTTTLNNHNVQQAVFKHSVDTTSQVINIRPSNHLLISKPNDTMVERRAIQQPSVPDSCREIPFIETAPAPDLTNEEKVLGYMLFQRPIMDPVYPNTHPLEYERLESLSAFATPGEFEPITFSIYPIRKLKNLKVRISSLKSDKGEIPISDLTVRLGTYWNIGYPRYTTQSTFRRAPELLEAVTVHTSPAKECQRYWIQVHVPSNAKPGFYHGKVTVWDDGFDKAVSLPVSFRVLDFSLKQDPKKHYSVYYYMRNHTQYDGKSDSWSKKASGNEYKAMVEFGLDVAPTLYLKCNDKARKVFSIQGADELERMLKAGMKGPIPLAGGNGIAAVYTRMTPGGKRGSHWNITKMPPPEFYTELTKMFKAFEKMRKAKGWPAFICCPLDEVASSKKEFGRKVYKAVQNAGIKTYITKDPKAVDAVDYKDCVDIWCSQPFSTPYSKIIKQKKYEYWSYPNHNAGELKNKTVMCKGGRMTYGFGLWRSGFTTLVPWHWSWTPGSPTQFDYLRGSRSGCGQRLTEDGEVIPAVYWECFREGIDDARYIYTLQQAFYERMGSKNKDCEKVVKNAEDLLQKLWNDIPVQKKYLASGMWPSSEFNARRWHIAQMIEHLLKYPAIRHGIAPSVLVANTSPRSEKAQEDVVAEGLKKGMLASVDITGDKNDWVNSSQEGKLSESPDGAFRWTVNVNHKLDKNGKKGKYVIGWPLIRQKFYPRLDMTKYDYLTFRMKVDSNRDEVSDDTTPIGLTIQSNKFYEKTYDLGGRQRVWVDLRLPIKDLIDQVDQGKKPWRKIGMIQIFIAERKYAHGTKLQFDIGKINLLKFKFPVISQVEVSKYILLPANNIVFKLAVMGIDSTRDEKMKMNISLTSSTGKPVIQMSKTLASGEEILALDAKSLSVGEYTYNVAILNNENKIVSEKTGNIHCLSMKEEL